MPLTTIPLPYGLRDVKILAYTDAAGTTLDSVSIDLPYARVFSFSETEDFQQLRGDDRVVAQRGAGPVVEWELESGGVSLEAAKALTGGTITATGTAPAQKKTLAKKTTDQRPWFKAEGQMISDSGGDFHAVVYKCKTTGDFGGEFQDGEFFLTGVSGIGIGNSADALWDYVQNETAVAITP